MEKIKVSIIIPVYNKEKYIEELFQCLVNQSFEDFECILVDDGSTDTSGKICDMMSNTDSRFITYHIENGGVSHARNYAIEKAKGIYLTFIDADDKLDRNYLSNLYNLIINKNVDIVVGAYKKIWDDSNQEEIVYLPDKIGKYTINDILSSFAKDQKDTGIYGCCVAKIFKKELISSIRFDENIKLAEDFDFYLKIYSKVRCVYIDDKPYYLYRQEADNSSSIVDDYTIDYLSQLKINLRYQDFLKEMNYYALDNKIIVDQLISNYIYFSIFYCPFNEMNERIKFVHKLCKSHNIILIKDNAFKKIIFYFFEKNKVFWIKLFLIPYRMKKKLVWR